VAEAECGKLMVSGIKSTVFWYMTPCSLVDNCRRFGKNLTPPSSG
jgi:hypothetical protein